MEDRKTAIQDHSGGERPVEDVGMADHGHNRDDLSEEVVEVGIPDSDQQCEKTDKKNRQFGEVDDEEYPEGGRGWLVLLGTFLILNTTYGMVNTFGVYQVYYETTYPDESSSTISLIGSLQPTIIYLVSIPVVFLVNSIGPQWSLFVGAILQVWALMMISICNAVWQLYLAQGVLFGIGAGINFFTAMAIPQEWFKRRRAMAVGVTASGSSLGGVIWPIAFQRLVDEVGFPWANRIIGFIFLPVLLFSCVAVKPRLPRVKEKHWTNLLPKWSVLKDWRFVALCLANGIGIFGLFPPLFYIETFASRLNVSENVSGYILAILNACSIFGRVLPALISDKIGRLNALVPSVLSCGLFLFAFWYPAKGEALLLLTAIIWGAASGTFIALFPPAIGQLFGLKDNRSRLGIFYLLAVPGCMAGPSIAGTFISTTGGIEGFNKVAAFSGAMFFGGALIVIALRLSYSTKLKVFI